MKKDLFTNKKAIAYYSGLNGLEIYDIVYGIEDYVLYTTGAWNGNLKHHKSKILYTKKGEPYFKCNGYTIKLNECIRM